MRKKTHKLQGWLAQQGCSAEWLADRLGVKGATVQSWMLSRRAPGRRTPRAAMMARIFVLSGGAVKPQDFFPLDEWHRDLELRTLAHKSAP